MRPSILATAALLALGLVAGCKPANEPPPAVEPAATPGTAASNLPPAAKPSDYAERRDIAREQIARLLDGKYADLEESARQLVHDRTTLRSGMTRRQAFYDAFSPDDWNEAPDWKRWDRALTEWREKFPDSEAARIASAQFYTGYAWEARGSGYANTVTAEGWRLFGERLKTGFRLLEGVTSPEMRNEAYWSTWQTLALGLQMEAEDYLDVVEAALKTSPYRQVILSRAVIYLLPRWNGEPGEWQRWLQAQTPGPEFDEDYAVAAASAIRYVGTDDGPPFGMRGANWARAKAGWQKRLAAFPDSPTVATQFLRMAVYANDRETARAIVAAMPNGYEPGALPKRQLADLRRLLE